MTDFKAKKCTKFDFGWGSDPDPAGGAYSAPHTPKLDLRGGPLRSRGRGWAGEEEGKEGGGTGGEGKGGPQVTVEPGPLRALLRH